MLVTSKSYRHYSEKRFHTSQHGHYISQREFSRNHNESACKPSRLLPHGFSLWQGHTVHAAYTSSASLAWVEHILHILQPFLRWHRRAGMPRFVNLPESPEGSYQFRMNRLFFEHDSSFRYLNLLALLDMSLLLAIPYCQFENPYFFELLNWCYSNRQKSSCIVYRFDASKRLMCRNARRFHSEIFESDQILRVEARCRYRTVWPTLRAGQKTPERLSNLTPASFWAAGFGV